MGESAVDGLDVFRSYMKGLEGSYAIIGGTACDILLSDADLPFRATHDLDVVLVANNKLPNTARAIWQLVKDGGYSCAWGQGERVCFYRFTNPKTSGYPRMLELFSKEPDFLAGSEDVKVAPLHVNDEDVSSLSAILLNDDYYKLLLDGICTVRGISILDVPYLIPFKAKAYLDLKARRERAGDVDAHKVRKHLNDVLRLAQLLAGNERVEIPVSVYRDVNSFVLACEKEPVRLKQIGVAGISMKEIIATLKSVYVNSALLMS